MYNYNHNYNYGVYGRGINEDEFVHSEFQEQKIPYWQEKKAEQKEFYSKNLNKNRNFNDDYNSYNYGNNYNYGMNNNLNNNYYEPLNQHRYIMEDEELKQIPNKSDAISTSSDLLKELHMKNTELLKLNNKIIELENTKYEMFVDLERYETEFQMVEDKFLNKQNELLDQIQILELEKENLSKKLNYYEQIFPATVTKNNCPSELFSLENKRLQEELYIKDGKLKVFFEFYIQLQNQLFKKSTQINILENLEAFAFKYRFNEIIESLKSLMSINSANIIKDQSLDVVKQFIDMKSENKSGVEEKDLLKSKQIKENSLEKPLLMKIDESPIIASNNKKKISFIPPEQSPATSVEISELNHHLNTEIEIVEKKNIEMSNNVKPVKEMSMIEEKNSNKERSEKTSQKINIKAPEEEYNNFKELMKKYEQEKSKVQESEKSMKKSENGNNKPENKANVSGLQKRKSKNGI